ncbi:MAG TPA: dihydroneopterin aldolase [Edaphocola sp.]|nr:dihydroneopterin aldolase [Edaphocola sp.]
MYSVSLAGLRFQCPIGLYPEEMALENDLEVNLTLSRDSVPTAPPLLDYEVVYNIVAEEVRFPESLLESLLDRIVLKIFDRFPDIRLSIEIRKWHPPFGGRADYAAVKWENF